MSYEKKLHLWSARLEPFSIEKSAFLMSSIALPSRGREGVGLFWQREWLKKPVIPTKSPNLSILAFSRIKGLKRLVCTDRRGYTNREEVLAGMGRLSQRLWRPKRTNSLFLNPQVSPGVIEEFDSFTVSQK